MNEHADGSELPELTDEGIFRSLPVTPSQLTNTDVELLYAICKRASTSDNPPFKALFAAYDDVFAEQQIEQQHDGVVFRYLMRIGESTRTANRERRPVNLVEQLRNVLEAHGVTFVEPSEADAEDVTEPIIRPNATERKPFESPKRRVSFDDARLEETWLSEHSEPVNPDLGPAQSRLLSLPPRRSRDVTSARRARSTSSQRNLPIRNAAPKHFQHASTESVSEPDDLLNPPLLFEPSQTQLEQNAQAFLSASAIRSARQTLRIWHSAALQRQGAGAHAYSIAVAHDRRTLLKQALDQWRETLNIKRHEHRRLKHLKHLEEKTTRCRNLFLLTKAFTHWATSCQYEQLRTKVAQRYMLKVTYFKKWRAIASENQMKVRRVLVRKYLAVWREKTARRLLWQEQATAHYEETLMRKCKTGWFWHFCSRRVEGWHEQWVLKRALSGFRRCQESRQRQEQRAEEVYHSRLARSTLGSLRERLRERQLASASAEGHHDGTVTAKSFRNLQIQAKVAPIARTLTLRVNLNLERKALKVWHLHLSLSRQAAEVDRKRILQTAWTNWNDALRCNALAQKIDERVLVENLYRWVLQERLKLFQRTTDGRLLNRALGCWLSRIQQDRDRLAEAEVVFAERQHRRRLAVGMLRLNLAMRNREDAERTALEFKNGRTLPQVLEIWKDKTDHVRRLVKWAADARFYCLCTSTLKTWQEKTSEHKQNRRRDAYAQVRSRIKIRLVGNCFTRWRAKTMELRSMDGESERRAQGRLAEVGIKAFSRWREKTAQYSELRIQAAELDQQKLLGSALSAMIISHADLARMDEQAVDFRRETDLALLAGALRRFQWATFTAVRRIESAEALWARNRDQHIKQMLRHWAAQVATRKAAAKDDNEAISENEAESPSLRPASRAASRSADLALPSSPPRQSAAPTTPGYLRTPSRSRRAGRFRALPTPVPFTPMAFDSAYLATTPGPLPNTRQVEIDQSFVGLTPQVTPFERKLRAGGIVPGPPSAMRSVGFKRSPNLAGGGTNKSVRFAGASRFRNRSDDGHEKTS